jgi:hypothetical protein
VVRHIGTQIPSGSRYAGTKPGDIPSSNNSSSATSRSASPGGSSTNNVPAGASNISQPREETPRTGYQVSPTGELREYFGSDTVRITPAGGYRVGGGSGSSITVSQYQPPQQIERSKQIEQPNKFPNVPLEFQRQVEMGGVASAPGGFLVETRKPLYISPAPMSVYDQSRSPSSINVLGGSSSSGVAKGIAAPIQYLTGLGRKAEKAPGVDQYTERYGRTVGSMVAAPFIGLGELFYKLSPPNSIARRSYSPELKAYLEKGEHIPALALTAGALAVSPYLLGKIAITAAGAYSVGSATKSPTPENVAAATIMGAGGVAAASGIISRVLFIGKTFIPIERIAEPSIISGEKTFPTTKATPAGLVKEFTISPYKLSAPSGGFHATDFPFKQGDILVTEGTKAPGLHIAPSASIYFTREPGISQAASTPKFSLSFLEKSTPSIIYAETKVSRVPAAVRSGSISDINRYLSESAPKGQAYVSAKFEKTMSTEAEAILPKGAVLGRTEVYSNFWERATGFKYYTELPSGGKVKILMSRIKAGGDMPSASDISLGEAQRISQYARSSIAEPSSRSVTPYLFDVAGILSSRPRVAASSKYTFIPGSYKYVPNLPSTPSIIPPSSITYVVPPSAPTSTSIINYVLPPSTPSVIPPYNPPYTPPSVPATSIIPNYPTIPSLVLYGGYRPGTKRGVLPKRRTKYQPSLKGIVFNLKSSRVPGRLTGIETRPIVVPRNVGRMVRYAA